MKNFLIRLFLSLCLLLLSGYSHLYAHTNKGSIHHASTKSPESLDQASCDTAQKRLAFILKSASSDHKKLAFKLKAIENNVEEEVEHALTSSKRNWENSNYFSATFWAQALSYFFSSNKEVLPVGEHFSFIPATRRHLLFQVFRI